MKAKAAGKVKEVVLKRSVLKELSPVLSKDINKPQIGADATGVMLDTEQALLTSVATIEAYSDFMVMAVVHRALNNLWIQNAKPIGITLSTALRYGSSETELKHIMRSVTSVCQEFQIPVLGGETVRSSAESHIITVTAIGTKQIAQDLSNSFAGCQIVMAGNAGIVGTVYLYEKEREALRTRFSETFLQGILPMKNQVSIKAQKDCVDECFYAHDVSEGGIFAALWELGEYLNCGMRISLQNILLAQETIEVCEFFDVNPYVLYSLGCSIYVVQDGNALVDTLNQAGIRAAVIGTISDDYDRILDNGEEIRYLEPFKGDEIYKV